MDLFIVLDYIWPADLGMLLLMYRYHMGSLRRAL